ncbi:hypothetical protein [Bacteroides sp. 519]|uniref:hypothetical protein n=1 Tax=Bacteroides sp. 519 TaxID=2302937 RepID=UPI0013D328A2|nr:hypothetical protein [Bacteroides sp. 519]NDV59046.1 hypothetical protein [Bacteroides sp. 519]
MEVYLDSFIKAIEKRVDKNEIIGNLILRNPNTELLNEYSIPKSICLFYDVVNSIEISFPRKIVIMPPQRMILVDKRYLCFSIINETKKICFDTFQLNNDNEWNIVCLENNFLITKSFKSYITNKFWAWIDRGRHIWEEENYNL